MGDAYAELALYRHAPVRARIRRQLRGWIDDGTLTSGAPLDERALARKLGTSRTPVREALLLLAVEGLVVPRPHGGFSAAPMTRQEGEDLFHLMGHLERRALLRSGRPGALVLARLEELDAARLIAPDPVSRLATDRRWHHHLLPARRIGPVSRRELNRLEARAARYQLAFLTDGPHLLGPVEEHRAIVDALLDDRVGTAAKMLEDHWLGAVAAAPWSRPDGGGTAAEGPGDAAGSEGTDDEVGDGSPAAA